MRLSATLISLSLVLFLSGGGCSKEEEAPPAKQRLKIVKPIKRTGSKKVDMSKIQRRVKPPVAKKDPGEVKVVAAKPQELKRPAAPLDKPKDVPKTVAKRPERPAPWAVGGKPLGRRPKATSKAVGRKPIKAPGAQPRKKAAPMVEEKGYYQAKKGDSLSKIAARKDVYGDRLNWVVLYRLNRNQFIDENLGEDFPDTRLKKEVRLKIITPGEAKANIKKRTDRPWVVNVLSATDKDELNPAAIKLVKDGYKVYFTRARVRGKDWIRLRVGFFKNKVEADREGQKIMGVLDRVDTWSSKVGKKELLVFGGY